MMTETKSKNEEEELFVWTGRRGKRRRMGRGIERVAGGI